MKKALLFIFLALVPVVFTFSQNNTSNDNPVLNSTGLTYDSVMYVLNQKNVPFNIKYKLVSKDIQSLEPWEKTINIFFKTLSLAKEEKKNDEIFALYNAVATNYNIGRRTDKMKLYLDSASLYKNKVKDDYHIGVHYYLLASYYQIIGKENVSHENSYKAIEYFEKVGGKERLIISIYFNMSITYLEINDFSSVRKIIDKMRKICDVHYSFDSELHTNQVATNYYNNLHNKNKNSIYLDSAKYFSKKSIDLFESLTPVEQSIAKRHIQYDYTSYIDNELEAKIPDGKLIDKYMSKLEKLISQTDTSRLVWYHKINGALLTKKKEYAKAEKELQNSLHLLDSQKIGKSQIEYLGICETLAELYQKTGNFPKAIEYKELKEIYLKKIYEEKQYQIVKETDIKYETAKKDLEILHLNETQQKILYNRTLAVSGLVIVSILFLVAFLYNRIKRLKKEKETITLSQHIEAKEQEYINLKNEIESKKQKEFINGLESERSRLAKELHDGVSNDLVAIRMQINANGNKEDILNALTDIHANVRGTSHALMTPIFKEASFADILYDYTIQQQLKAGVNINLKIDPIDDWNLVSSTIGLELYRIVQESVSNAIKHGKASYISIEGMIQNGRLTLKIVDDGIGFDTTKKYSGIGLRILKDRANIINAKLDITSSNKGTEVVIDLEQY